MKLLSSIMKSAGESAIAAAVRDKLSELFAEITHGGNTAPVSVRRIISYRKLL